MKSFWQFRLPGENNSTWVMQMQAFKMLYKGLICLREAGWTMLGKHHICCPPFPLLLQHLTIRGGLYRLAIANNLTGTEAQLAALVSFCLLWPFQLYGLLTRGIDFRLQEKCIWILRHNENLIHLDYGRDFLWKRYIKIFVNMWSFLSLKTICKPLKIIQFHKVH